MVGRGEGRGGRPPTFVVRILKNGVNFTVDVINYIKI